MVTAEIIEKYFDTLSDNQKVQFKNLKDLYIYHNNRVNLISRKDTDNFYIHHILHSLALVKTISFSNLNTVVDIGTGGGFPGIPLAIMYPEVKFHLIDSIGKKINIVQEIANEVGLINVTAKQYRIEETPWKYDMAVARAVAPTIKLFGWMKGHWTNKPKFALLKGGDLSEELNELTQSNPRLKLRSHQISNYFEESFFETKKVISIEG